MKIECTVEELKQLIKENVVINVESHLTGNEQEVKEKVKSMTDTLIKL